MNYFYAPQIVDGITNLDEEESGHCIRVLRHKEGDTIGLLDGKGCKYEAVIEQANPKETHFRVINKKIYDKPAYTIHLAIAPTKNSDRMEWLVEKLTEIGITHISLFFSKNSERRKYRTDRLHKKIVSALKQSKNPFLPVLFEPEDFKKLLNKINTAQKFIAFIDKNNTRPLEGSIQPKSEVTILIGPEGDFTHDEVAMAVNTGFEKVSLGNTILRTETAGLIACHTIHLINRQS